jgi:hypothetical protein
MTLPSLITDNPPLVTGLVRALLIFAVTLGVSISQAQQDAALLLLAAVLPILSLSVTAATVMATVPKAPSADATPASIQVPQPAPTAADPGDPGLPPD